MQVNNPTSSTPSATVKLNLWKGYDTGVGVFEHLQNVVLSYVNHDGTVVNYPTKRIRVAYGGSGTGTAHWALVSQDDGTFGAPAQTWIGDFYINKADISALTATGMQFMFRALSAGDAAILASWTTATITKTNLQVVGSSVTTAAVSGITATITVIGEVGGYMRLQASLSGIPATTKKIRLYPIVPSNIPSPGKYEVLGGINLTGEVSVDRGKYYPQSQNEADGLVYKVAAAEAKLSTVVQSPVANGATAVFIGTSLTLGVSAGAAATNAERWAVSWAAGVSTSKGYNYVNKGIDGSTIAVVSGKSPMVSRFAADVTASNPAVVFVEGGCNDFDQSVPLGNIRSLNNNVQFYSATYNLLKGILDGSPTAMVYGVTDPYWLAFEWVRDGSGYDVSPIRNTAGHTLEQYRQALRDVIQKLRNEGYGNRLFLLDVGRDTKDSWVPAVMESSGAGRHPTPTGYQIWSDYILCRLP